MLGLTWPLSLGMKLAAIGLLIAATSIFTAIKVHHYVATEYENILLAEKVAVVTREKKIAVLDTKTLEKALNNERARIAREQERKEALDDIFKSVKLPQCELSDYLLCVWNDDNRRLLGDTTGDRNECSAKLPPAPGSEGREAGDVVAK